MSFSLKKTGAFVCACALCCAGWALVWPSPPAARLPVAATPPVAPVKEAWTSETLQHLIEAANQAPDDERRLEAGRRLSAIPVADLPVLMDKVSLLHGRELTFAAKVLLIHWAEADGEAATKWAWLHFRKAPRQTERSVSMDVTWADAFREIAPVWANRDPEQFARWVEAHIPASPIRGLDYPTDDEVRSSDEPLLKLTHRPEMETVTYLLRYSPRLAFELCRKWNAFSTDQGELVQSLETVSQIEEALLAFDDDPEGKHRNEFGYSLAVSLLRRWEKLDPDDYARSPHLWDTQDPGFKHWDESLRAWIKLPPGQRRAAVEQLMEEPQVPPYPSRVTAIVYQWASQDPQACGDWLETSAAKDVQGVVSAYIQSVAPIDPDLAIKWTRDLPSVLKQKELKIIYDAWAGTHPEKQPDFSDWKEDEREAWADLSFLRQATGR